MRGNITIPSIAWDSVNIRMGAEALNANGGTPVMVYKWLIYTP